ncbi:MAG: hypothetical protein QOH21_1803 [Acidobacteriota bacterium]|jgi:hypothetical protein|nr:hypothetical protein [Acidobacteriota bacterium]
MSAPIITVTGRGVLVRDVAALRDTFAREHVVRLPGCLGDELLARVERHIAEGTFAVREDAGIAVELCLQPCRALDLLLFVMNAPRLWEAVQEVTGIGGPASFGGRVYRFDPAVEHHDSWHDDSAGGGRLVGISVNLGRVPFRGGEFEIRAKGEPERIVSVANTGAGDAIVFRIAPELQHRVRPVVGDVPKTALAGWFSAGAGDYWDILNA